MCGIAGFCNFKENFEENTDYWNFRLEKMRAVLAHRGNDAKDMPDMTDVDSSLLYFCSLVSRKNKVALTGEDESRRIIGYLNIKWFMQTLLDRMDRTSMYSELEARVPFADHRIIEYVFNVPWHMKYQNGVEKTLLRDAFSVVLPPELLHRKKTLTVWNFQAIKVILYSNLQIML